MGFDLTPALQIKHRRQLSFTEITAANSYIPNIMSPRLYQNKLEQGDLVEML